LSPLLPVSLSTKRMGDTHATTLERRKHVSVRLRADLLIESQKYEGRTCYVVKDPVSLRYYRFKEREHFLLELMDGRHTLDDAQKEYEKHFRPARLSLEEIEGFARLLLTAGLAHNDSPRTGSRLFEQHRLHHRRRWLGVLSQVLYVQIPLFDPDRLLERLLGRLRWFFTKGFFCLGVALMMTAALLVLTHFDAFRVRLPSIHEFFNAQTLLLLWIAVGAVKVLHELGHGLSCKAFGGEVHEMGVLFLCFFPCLYCNVTDAWTLPSKWRRILISFAGIYVELLIASLATFAWWMAPAQPVLGRFCLGLMVACSVNTLFFNANPLLRYDGYYILADWLEVPNLRERSNRFLKHVALKHVLGSDAAMDAPMAPGRRVFFALYAIASYFYRWVITFGVLWFLCVCLEPYKLGSLGALLAALSAGSMLGRPLYRLIKTVRNRGRLLQMQRKRVLSVGSALAGVVLIACLAPLPIGRIRQTALVRLQPDAAEMVFVPSPAVLERLYVRDGQAVKQNDILAEFRSIDLETGREEARSEFEIRTVSVQALQERLASATDAGERARLEVARATTTGERAYFAREAEVLDKTIKRLVLRAPRAGVVMSPPPIDEVGKLWRHDEQSPFCVIGDPSRLRALVPVSPADYRLLKEELVQGVALTAAIRAPGSGPSACDGQVSRLPESEAAEIPFALTTHGGGPVPAEPTPSPGEYAPLLQQYVVGVDFLDPASRIPPGTLAQIQIHTRWRPAAWWLWQTIASTFDLGLL
jgi:putative peptide zinc metalloprotease protein